ncbi:hypothetical protein OAB57_01000 [Bacteriovoracaceae bacterium]|nr:hypothetical protein [Bacteriovoracaceae bacterium]
MKILIFNLGTPEGHSKHHSSCSLHANLLTIQKSIANSIKKEDE